MSGVYHGVINYDRALHETHGLLTATSFFSERTHRADLFRRPPSEPNFLPACASLQPSLHAPPQARGALAAMDVQKSR